MKNNNKTKEDCKCGKSLKINDPRKIIKKQK